MKVKFNTSAAGPRWSASKDEVIDTDNSPIDDETVKNYLAAGYCEKVKNSTRKAVQKPASRKAVERY